MTGRPGGAPYEAALYQLIIENVRDYAIFALDPNGQILTWNPAAQRLKGYAAGEVVGRHFSIFYPEEDRARDKPGFELQEAARTGRFEDEGWRVRKDGSRFWANVVITALRDHEGKLLGFAKVTRDLTERRAREEQARALAAESAAREVAEERRAEVEELNEELQQQAAELESQITEAQQLTEELEISNTELDELREAAERARAEAEAANRAKMDFLAAMSHELRTPLNAIAGYVELMELGIRGPITDEQRTDLERIRRSERYLLSLVNDVLNFAKLETGAVTIQASDVRIGALLHEVDNLIAPQARTNRLRYSTESCDPELSVHADAEKVQQVLLNLIGNAIKFTEPGGSITIDCHARANEVAIVVIDTGCGIPPDQLDAIFEPFVQIGRTLTYPIVGAGLGLAISRDLARAMGGDITVESMLGEGATFTLVLPRGGGGGGGAS